MKEKFNKFRPQVTLVTLGCSSLCHTATSCVKADLSEAISASVLWPSSPQSRSLTEHKKAQKCLKPTNHKNNKQTNY